MAPPSRDPPSQQLDHELYVGNIVSMDTLSIIEWYIFGKLGFSWTNAYSYMKIDHNSPARISLTFYMVDGQTSTPWKN